MLTQRNISNLTLGPHRQIMLYFRTFSCLYSTDFHLRLLVVFICLLALKHKSTLDFIKWFMICTFMAPYTALTCRWKQLNAQRLAKKSNHQPRNSAHLPSHPSHSRSGCVIGGDTHSYPLHFQEDCSLEGLLPDSEVSGQLHPEGVALAVADQNTEAQRLAVLLLRWVLEPQVEPRLEPAVLRHPQL